MRTKQLSLCVAVIASLGAAPVLCPVQAFADDAAGTHQPGWAHRYAEDKK